MPLPCNFRHHPHRARGSAMALIIIVSIILTGLVMSIAWAAGVQTQSTSGEINMDRAYFAAENALQLAAWQFKHDNTWRQASAPSTLPTLTVDGKTYTYAVTCVTAGATATLAWPFSENTGLTTADISGHNNTGTLIGGVTWLNPGRYGPALTFNGIDGYVDAGSDPSTNIVGSVTMSAWVRMNSAAQDQKVGGNQDGVVGGYKMSIYNTKVEFETRDANNTPWLNRSVGGGTVMTMGTWYHVAGVFSTAGQFIKTYVNGVLDRELDNVPANAIASTQGSFRMGREPWNGSIGTTRYFNGAIDDVRVYNRVLSDQEIKALADTTVTIHSVATLQNTNPAVPTASYTLNANCSIPTPPAPIAPAITAGGNVDMKSAVVTGDLQTSANFNASANITMNGRIFYGGTYALNAHTVTFNPNTYTATLDTTRTVPTINYASIQSQATSTATAGTGQTYTFVYNAGVAPVIYVNGNVTDPVINTSAAGGTLLINGTLTLTKDATFGADGFPAYIVCQNAVNQTGGTLTLYGALFVKGDWTHTNCTIFGDVCVTGKIVDNSTATCNFTAGPIVWFDPRSATPAPTLPLYYTAFSEILP